MYCKGRFLNIERTLRTIKCIGMFCNAISKKCMFCQREVSSSDKLYYAWKLDTEWWSHFGEKKPFGNLSVFFSTGEWGH